MTWQPSSYAEGLRMAWDEDDDGVEHCLAHIEPRMPYDGVVVDIGCGVGRLTVPLVDRRVDLSVIGFDTSGDMLDQAYQHIDWDAYRGQILLTDTWPDQEFDAAFSVAVFQHIPDHVAVEYIYRVAPRPFVFQFVEGLEREPLSMQRPVKWVAEWVRGAGYRSVEIDGDDRFDNWRWVYAR